MSGPLGPCLHVWCGWVEVEGGGPQKRPETGQRQRRRERRETRDTPETPDSRDERHSLQGREARTRSRSRERPRELLSVLAFGRLRARTLAGSLTSLTVGSPSSSSSSSFVFSSFVFRLFVLDSGLHLDCICSAFAPFPPQLGSSPLLISCSSARHRLSLESAFVPGFPTSCSSCEC